MSDVWIAGISRGHNGAVCLLKNGEIVFSIEEERLSRRKYDGAPLAGMLKIQEYTKKLDYLVLVHTQGIHVGGRLEFSGDDVYSGLARKIGLIEDRMCSIDEHPQVIEISDWHHKMHAAAAFYRSPFESAAVVVADGAGSVIAYKDQVTNKDVGIWEYETIFEAAYPAIFKTRYKHMGTAETIMPHHQKEVDGEFIGEPGNMIEIMTDDRVGITKVYEAVTSFLQWQPIEAGKTMGLFPYGVENPKIPPFFDKYAPCPGTINRNMIMPNTPNGAFLNVNFYEFLGAHEEDFATTGGDITKLDIARDIAYKCQKETQAELLKLIRKAAEDTGNNNVIVTGGYALNCVANYEFLQHLKEDGITLYVEPISNDAGTAIGGALYHHYMMTNDDEIRDYGKTLYLGPKQEWNQDDVKALMNEEMTLTDATHEDVVDLLVDKNIVTIFQGRSENGPRALGNRSILFDPTFPDGKDYVNSVKNREYFRPFAGTVLEEDAHEWFDLRGMQKSPHMMYAVNCQPGVEDKIPSIIHVDETCRIQTVSEEENKHYYNLIKAFKNRKGVPILFNTSFNLGGDPLVETIADAIDTLKKCDIQYMYLPEIEMLLKVPN
jgi:carbamoyltransferase